MPLAEDFPVQLQCVNSEGSQEDPVTWSGGERGDGRNHLFAELSLFISNFLTNLHGRTLGLARVKEVQSALHCSVIMGFPQTPEQAQAQPLLWGLTSLLLHLPACGWLHPGGVWGIWTGWWRWFLVLYPGSKPDAVSILWYRLLGSWRAQWSANQTSGASVVNRPHSATSLAGWELRKLTD